MLLSQSLRQVCKNHGDVTKRFSFHKSLNKGRKMHLDTTRDFSSIAGKQTKISCLNKIILMSAVIDRNMTSASMVHVLLCIIWLGTAWIGYKRDFTAADVCPKPLLTKDSPEMWGLHWGSKFERDFLSNSYLYPWNIPAAPYLTTVLPFSSLPLTRFVMTKGCCTLGVLMRSELQNPERNAPLELHMMLTLPAASNISYATMSSHIWLTASHLFPSTQLCFGNIATPTSLADWTPSKLNPELSLWLSPLVLGIFCN